MKERNLYQEFFERSPDALLVIEDDRFIECNPAAVRMLRFPSRQALLDRYAGDTGNGSLRAHPGEFSPPRQPDGRDSFEKADEMMELAFERGSHRFEWDHVRADGEVFPVEVTLTAVRGGKRPTLHVVWREIDERRRLEKALRQAQRLEAVGRLAGGVAHDFNNLLVVIFSHAELLADLLEKGSPALEHVEEIRLAGERAAALTQQLLAVSRGQPIQPRPLDLTRLLGNLGTLLRRLIGENVELVLDLVPGPVTILADASQIEQLVINLAANARDAMTGGGRLEIGLTREEHDPTESRLPLSAGEYAVLCVRDTGSGMNREQIERAFDPFFTTKPLGKGAGLGLATVRAVAEQNGGAVVLESGEGQGTSVRVLLPLTAADPVEPLVDAEPALDLEGSETILLVEDEGAIRGLLEGVLRRRGYRVLSAADGAEALALFEEYGAPIDLLLTDVVMPRISGPELVRQISEIQPDLEVIYMSGYSQENVLRGTKAHEEVRILQKPFSPRRLLAELRSVLDRRV